MNCNYSFPEFILLLWMTPSGLIGCNEANNQQDAAQIHSLFSHIAVKLRPPHAPYAPPCCCELNYATRACISMGSPPIVSLLCKIWAFGSTCFVRRWAKLQPQRRRQKPVADISLDSDSSFVITFAFTRYSVLNTVATASRETPIHACCLCSVANSTRVSLWIHYGLAAFIWAFFWVLQAEKCFSIEWSLPRGT